MLSANDSDRKKRIYGLWAIFLYAAFNKKHLYDYYKLKCKIDPLEDPVITNMFSEYMKEKIPIIVISIAFVMSIALGFISYKIKQEIEEIINTPNTVVDTGLAKPDQQIPPKSDDDLDDINNLRKAAQKWKDRNWMSNDLFTNILQPFERNPNLIKSEGEKNDYYLLEQANKTLIARRGGSNFLNKVNLCFKPSDVGDYEENEALLSKIVSAMGNRYTKSASCQLSDIVISAKEESFSYQNRTSTLYASVFAKWVFDDAALNGFPISSNDYCSDHRLDDNDAYYTKQCVMNNVSEELSGKNHSDSKSIIYLHWLS